MRFLGLIDDANVYQTWRVPNPTAPYPQDYIVDQQGVVQYWSDQFDPQAVISTIDRLLGTNTEEPPRPARLPSLVFAPNPLRAGHALLRWDMNELGRADSALILGLEVYDGAGRLVQRSKFSAPRSAVVLDCRSLRPGVYLVRLATGSRTALQKLVLQP
jgi:hypothetical protein